MSATKAGWPGSPLSLLWLLSLLYFAQGLPAGLLAKAMPALARDAGMSTQWIGLLALAALPWALKFIWAPWVDRLGCGQPNHRKRWMMGCIVGVLGVLLATSLLPSEWLFVQGFAVLLALLFLMNLFSATQDIATDGLATRMLSARLRGPGNSIQVGGYKVGLILGSGLLLILVDVIGWQQAVWLVMLALLLVLWKVSRFNEPVSALPPRQAMTFGWWRQRLLGFWRHPGMGVWLIILLGYKVGDGFGSRMIKPFLIDMQLSLSEVGQLDIVSSLVGLGGAALGGLLMIYMARRTALVSFALLHAVAFVGWAAMAHGAPMIWLWPVALFEQLVDGMATVALFVVMMDYCRKDQEGSDYTLQASIQLFAVGLFTLSSGFSVAAFGYGLHFTMAALMCGVVIIATLFWRPPVTTP